jgi:type 1 glutamine amidotransferase
MLHRWALTAALLGVAATQSFAETPRVLMFTKSAGFQHSVVTRKKETLGLAERTVIELGKKHGFEVTTTKDGREINPENLKKFQGLFFFTQGDLTKEGLDRQPPMDPAHRAAILEFVRAGGGFVGTHCGGADTFHEWKENGKAPFHEMVGGEFIGHGPQQVARVEVVDPNFPAVKVWPKSFTLNDEWYAYSFPPSNMHVLMMLQTEGMKGSDYKRPSYPITWCSEYGKGRVFYTGLGHRDDVWENPQYQEMVATGVLWTLGKVDGSAEPNLGTLFGDVEKAMKRINKPQ